MTAPTIPSAPWWGTRRDHTALTGWRPSRAPIPLLNHHPLCCIAAFELNAIHHCCNPTLHPVRATLPLHCNQCSSLSLHAFQGPLASFTFTLSSLADPSWLPPTQITPKPHARQGSRFTASILQSRLQHPIPFLLGHGPPYHLVALQREPRHCIAQHSQHYLATMGAQGSKVTAQDKYVASSFRVAHATTQPS